MIATNSLCPDSGQLLAYRQNLLCQLDTSAVVCQCGHARLGAHVSGRLATVDRHGMRSTAIHRWRMYGDATTCGAVDKGNMSMRSTRKNGFIMAVIAIVAIMV